MKQNHQEQYQGRNQEQDTSRASVDGVPFPGAFKISFRRSRSELVRLKHGTDNGTAKGLAHGLAYGLVTAAFCASLCLSTEQRAYAYVDPGSGLLMLQAAGALFTGALFTLRKRLKALLSRNKTVEPKAMGRNPGA
ncbi:MAG: hypothetical protein ACP5E5_09020 [Acidobacteriaceae bacterium]